MPSHSRPFANLLIRERRKIGGIAIDGVISEQTSRTMRATEFPVESGDTISDHIIRQPMQYQMEGVITDTPMGLDGILETVSSVVDGVSGLFGSSENSAFTRSQQIYDELIKLMEKREVIEIQTTLGLIRNLAFETITVSQDKDNSRSVFFSATFKEVVFVDVEPLVNSQELIPSDSNKASYGLTENFGRGQTPDIPDSLIG